MASKQKTPQEQREAKLEAAMRANLARRKTQLRAREAQNPPPTPPNHPDRDKSKG